MTATASENSRYGLPDSAIVSGRIANAGDGLAFNCHLVGASCEVEIGRQDSDVHNRVGLMRSGDSAQFSASCDLEDWDRAVIELVWTEPPTRLNRTKNLSLQVAEHCERPTVRVFNTRTGHYDERTI
ncbi:hypothetical protein [Arthrobacter burdickii]|uniref:Uncharacterized protein n=1 Tax=Arthrobacter burdickii TaxID=3035920 RepID=A0ABT8K3B6_9MICC|nr:hypothetical protein [Arthrobacter burdickii]MDN4611936.1 hypothetical protein [Arthrobacter burdickii]